MYFIISNYAIKILYNSLVILTKVLVLALCLNISISYYSTAQDQTLEKDVIINNILESINISDEDEQDESYISELESIVSYYIDNPMNINTASRADLEKLSFISPIYINEIINYREHNGSFTNIDELNFIESIDGTTLETLKHVLAVYNDSAQPTKINIRDVFKNIKQHFFSSYYQTLKKAVGYYSDKGYLGANYGTRSFYKINSVDRLYGNIQINKVPGAPFNKGSFVSGYLLIKNLGLIKSLHVGDYQLQFGQGLVFWGGYSLNKSYDPINIIKYAKDDVLYNSSLSYGFNRGLSILIGVNNLQIRSFISYKGIDARLVKDNDSYKISSILSNSYYRTKSEIDSRNTATELITGLSATYNVNKNLDVSILAASESYNLDFLKPSYPYKLFQNYDKNRNYLSISYNYQNENYMLFGETSTLNFKEGAAILGATAVLYNRLIFSILYRNFSKGYIARYANVISESNTYNDELGIYTSMKYVINKKLQLSVFIDNFKFSWLKYQVDAPSDGIEVGSLLSYSPFKYLSTTLKYRFKTRAYNFKTETTNFIKYYNKHSIELRNNFKVNEEILVRTYIEASKYNADTGLYLGQEWQYKVSKGTILGLTYGIFSTDSYDSRIYIAEYYMPYSWPFIMLYGNGQRLVVFSKHKYNSLKINVLYSLINYKDATSIGSGLSKINGNNKPYVKIQVTYDL